MDMKLKSRRTPIYLACVFVFVFLSIVLISFIFAKTRLVENVLFVRACLYVTMVVLAILLLIVVVEVLSPFFVPSATWNTAFIAIILVGLVLFSTDGRLLENEIWPGLLLNETIKTIWGFIEYGLFALFCIFMFRFVSHDFRYQVQPFFRFLSLGLVLLTVPLYIGLHYVRLEWVALIPLFGIAFFWFVIVLDSVSRFGTINPIFVLSMVVFSAATGLISVETVGRCTSIYAMEGTGWLCGGLASLMFLGVYLYFTLSNLKKAALIKERDQQLEEVATSVLRNQLSSHFVFNTLNLIKALYRESIDEGDRALDLLSTYFRSYTEAGDVYLVPLSKELDLVTSYMDLQNLKGQGFDLILNIEEYDYQVPYFSLQPLLENAVLYSGVSDREDGYVQIDSTREGDYYHLVFQDNGCGFDVDSVQSSSVGLRNIRHQFKLLLNAEMRVESAIGQGTKIIIDIPINNKKSEGIL